MRERWPLLRAVALAFSPLAFAGLAFAPGMVILPLAMCVQEGVSGWVSWLMFALVIVALAAMAKRVYGNLAKCGRFTGMIDVDDVLVLFGCTLWGPTATVLFVAGVQP